MLSTGKDVAFDLVNLKQNILYIYVIL